MRRLLAAALACLSALLLVISAAGWWTSATAMDTQRFVAVAGPVIDQPEVQAALTAAVADELTSLGGPSALAPVVRNWVAAVIAGPGFHAVWYAGLTTAHQDVTAALTGPAGSTATISGSDGTVSVDLIQVVTQVLAALPADARALLGHGRTLHLSSSLTSAQARAHIATYLDRGLPAGFGTVPVASTTTMDRARVLVRVLDGTVVVLGAAGLLLALAALAVSRRRRHTIGQVGLWGAVFTAGAYLGLQQACGLAAGAVPAGAFAPAVTAVIHTLFDSLWVPTLVLCVAGVILAGVGYLPLRGR